MTTEPDSAEKARKDGRWEIPSGGWSALLLVWAAWFGFDAIYDFQRADADMAALTSPLWWWTVTQLLLSSFALGVGAVGVGRALRK